MSVEFAFHVLQGYADACRVYVVDKFSCGELNVNASNNIDPTGFSM